MPIYHMFCRECFHEFKAYRSIKEDVLEFVPNVNMKHLEVVFYPVNIKIGGEPKTLGALAEQNSKRMGHELVQRKMEEYRNENTGWHGEIPDGARIETKKPERPFYRPDRDTPDTALAKYTPEQQFKYMAEGKRVPGT